MASKFSFHLDKALNFPGAGQLIADKGINALNDALRARGESAKAKMPKKKEDGEDMPPEEDAGKDWTPLMDEVLQGIDAHESSLETLDKAVKDNADTVTKDVSALKTANTELAKRVEVLETQLKALTGDRSRRASQADETKLSDTQEKEAQDAIKNRTTEFDPMFPGMNVPMPNR